jgi:hypothetical protein
MKYIVLGSIIIATIVSVPFGFIWSLNVLFSLSISYTIKTWLASMLFLILLGNSSGIKYKKEKNNCCSKKK